jgi:hypothetical protein
VIPTDQAKRLIARLDALKMQRANYESELQDIVDLVRPAAADFNRQGAEGEARWQYKYDGTAPQALDEFSSGLCSFLVSSTERWFELEFDGYDPRWDHESLSWLQSVTELIYAVYRNSAAGFSAAMHEAFLDIGSFGTTVVCQELKKGAITIRTHPLARNFLVENESGQVDTVFRQEYLSTRGIIERFDKTNDYIHESIRKAELAGEWERKWPILHCVYPRRSYGDARLSANFPIASVWVDLTNQVIIRESGYSEMPYHVARWIKFAEEPYGRSPAHACLPEIRMVNQMEKVNIKAGQKAVDPPLMVPDDAFVLPIKTHPGSLLFKAPGTENIEPLTTAESIPMAIELTEQKREQIRKCFHVDWFKMGKENKEMTAFEVDDRRSEKLRFLAPMLGRLQTELIGPMIARTFNLLRVIGLIPPVPSTLATRPISLKVTYVGTAAKAQLAVRAASANRFIQDLLPMAQIKPDVLDVVDEDALAQELAMSRGVPRNVLRSPDALAQMREERRRQQQLQQLTEAAEPASKAVKNLADARATGMM